MMKLRRFGALAGWLAALIFAVTAFAPGPTLAASKPKRLLVVTVTKGFRHTSIPLAEKVLAQVGEKSGAYTVDYVRNDQDMAEKMTPEKLRNYDGVVFESTTGNLPLPDKAGFLNWIKSGGAFIGMHAATDTFHDTNGIDPYIEMLGGEFKHHDAQVEVECLNQDPKHPATHMIGKSFGVKDEIYQMKNFFRDRVHGLLTLDKHPNTGQPGDYPIAWCKMYGKGRVFYTSLGHREDVWENPVYQQHILGGIKWALGLAPGNATPQPLKYDVSMKEKLEGFRPLFDGVDLKGWSLRDPKNRQSWSAQNLMLVNLVSDKDHGTDLVTNEKFRDFTARYEYMIPTNSNSGFYLRGRHEIQILDDYAQGAPTPGGNGAIYRLAPVSKFVSRKPGQWQTVEVTMRGNRVTVILNGVKVHDNVLVDRPTGGELDQNVNEPGPIMLQGDHGSVAFRNLRIKTLSHPKAVHAGPDPWSPE
jgi:type 1 glutamine amidotransferase